MVLKNMPKKTALRVKFNLTNKKEFVQFGEEMASFRLSNQ